MLAMNIRLFDFIALRGMGHDLKGPREAMRDKLNKEIKKKSNGYLWIRIIYDFDLTLWHIPATSQAYCLF